MRLIGKLSTMLDAERIANYLNSKQIANSIDSSFDPTSGHITYQLWIHEEDKIHEATQILQEFQKNPSDPKYQVAVIQPPPAPSEEIAIEVESKRFHNYFTNLMIALCAVVFFFNTMQMLTIKKALFPEQLLTPLQALFMYDLPPSFEKVEKLVEEYGFKDRSQIKNIDPKLGAEVLKAIKTPYWKGAYTWVVNKIRGVNPSQGEGPLFIRIRQGEIWRLFTPCLLHQGLLHILFNMLWVWYLGRPIEQRIGPSRILVLTLIAGVGSNTVQYFMSGPFFIGYSGIVAALAGFIWMRERTAPWEGYPLNRGTLLFLAFFIAAIFALQVVAFFFQIFSSYQFTPNIANSAHISGAIIGALLAKFPFFAQRVAK